MGVLERFTVRGDGRARGLQHGEHLRTAAQEHMKRWKAALAEDMKLDPELYIETFLAETNFLPAARRWTPDLLAELEGIAQGANMPFRDVLTRMLSDEEPWYRREKKVTALRERGCSSIGQEAADGRPALVAQNMDVPKWWHGSQFVLHAVDPATGIECMVITVAGKISLAGINSRGLAIACNTLAQLDYARDGLAEDLVVRGFLTQPDLDAGLRFMRGIKHASGQNYTLGGPDGRVINLECSARSVQEFRLPGSPGYVFHTNHPLASRDTACFDALTQGLPPAQTEPLFFNTSRARFAALESFLSKAPLPLTAKTCQEALSLHDGPVCRHGEIEGRTDHFTLASLVMECGDSPRLHIAGGPPCETVWQTFTF